VQTGSKCAKAIETGTFYNGQLYLLMMAVIKCIIAQIAY
jgi:hypothetical protein